MSYPQLMTFQEKYGDESYLVASSEEIHRLAVLKIRERAQIGYYPIDVKIIERERELAIADLIKVSELSDDRAPRTIDELKAVPGTDDERAAYYLGVDAAAFAAYPESIRLPLLRTLKKFEEALPRVINGYATEIEDAKSIQRILTEEHAEELTYEFRGRTRNLALWILDSRSDYEYESYSLEAPLFPPTAEALAATRIN